MPLNGWFERNAFHPIWMALLVLALGFVLFQFVVAPLVGLIFLAVEMGRMPTLVEFSEGFQTNGAMMLTANSLGQFIGFALLAVVVSRLHSSAGSEFLRARGGAATGFVLAAVGWAALYPAVMWVGQLNASVQLPETLRTLEQMQEDMIEGLLLGNTLSTPALLIAFAVTPAICEELLFRGYLQRQVERSWGTLASLLVVGVVFGGSRLTPMVPSRMGSRMAVAAVLLIHIDSARPASMKAARTRDGTPATPGRDTSAAAMRRSSP